MKDVIKRLVPLSWRLKIKHKRFEWRARRYHGANVHCPCCGGDFSEFLPYGEFEQRPDAACPKCNSLERMRLLWLYLEKEVGLFSSAEPLTIYHGAPERAIEQQLRAAGHRYTSFDIQPAYAMVQADLQNLPFPDNSADWFILNHVLDVVPDEKKALSEIKRVLKPGGSFLIQQNLLEWLDETREVSELDEATYVLLYGEGEPEYLREYGMDFSQRLKGAGFQIQQVDYYSSFTTEVQRRFGLQNEPIYLCTKP